MLDVCDPLTILWVQKALVAPLLRLCHPSTACPFASGQPLYSCCCPWWSFHGTSISRMLESPLRLGCTFTNNRSRDVVLATVLLLWSSSNHKIETGTRLKGCCCGRAGHVFWGGYGRTLELWTRKAIEWWQFSGLFCRSLEDKILIVQRMRPGCEVSEGSLQSLSVTSVIVNWDSVVLVSWG